MALTAAASPPVPLLRLMPPGRSSFLDKVLGRLDRLDPAGVQAVLHRLERERSLLETLFNTIEDGVLVVDNAGRLQYANEAARRLLALPADAEGAPVQDHLPALDWEKLRSHDSAGGPRVLRQEFEVSRPRPRFLRLFAAPLDGAAAGGAGMALILHDATEARQKTFEAIESERVQALTLLAASVAHEIGNPLNALNIHLQLLERELRRLRRSLAAPAAGPARARGRAAPPADGDRADALASLDKSEGYLGVARGEIARLDYIITQFLQALRPTPPRLEPDDLNRVVRQTLDLLRPELENRGLLVEERLERLLPAAPLDAGQMQQVLVNLIKNALQAMTRGGTLTLETGRTPDAVWVSVKDTGGGIPPEAIHHIFEPYYTTKKKGSGLGLMIVHRIVRAHHGRIDLESGIGQGTRFRLWLPLPPRPPLLEEKMA